MDCEHEFTIIEISTGTVRCFSCGEYVTPTGRTKVFSDLAKKYKEMKK